MIYVQGGNTVTLSCNFKNPDGIVENPDLVKIKFYNSKSVLLEEIVLGDGNKTDVGKYKYYYSTPVKNQTITYEWYAEYAGRPIVKRDKFTTTFV